MQILFGKPIRPLRGYFLTMGAILVLVFWVDPLVRQTTAWQDLFMGQSQMVILFGERLLLILEALIVLLSLFIMGVKRREAFLAVGNLNASVGGQSASTRRREFF